MIYTRNGKYYLKKPEKMLEIMAFMEGNDVNLVPVGKSTPVSNSELNLYRVVTLADIKAELTKKPEKVEKPVKAEEVKNEEPENEFIGFFSKTKNKKTI